MSTFTARRTNRRSSHRLSNNKEQDPSEMTVADVISEDKRFKKFAQVLEKAGSGLRDELGDSESEWVLFAPSNMAMEKLEHLIGKNRREATPFDSVLPSVEDIIKYHMVRGEIKVDKLFDGMLLESELKGSKLSSDKERQKIRVGYRMGSWNLNMYVRVEESMSISCSNGRIFAIDLVLIPPFNALEVLVNVPFITGIFSAALLKTKVCEDLVDEKGITVFAPSDLAWKSMHIDDLIYLFSPLGRKDLEKVLEYHICPELTYAQDILEKVDDEIKLETLLKDEQICVKVTERPQHERKFTKDEKVPNQHLILINGESVVRVTDVIAENGNIHLINQVLIPKCVVLPSMCGKGGNVDSAHYFDF